MILPSEYIPGGGSFTPESITNEHKVEEIRTYRNNETQNKKV